MSTATHESSQTINLPADQVDRMTDRQLAAELAIGLQDLVNATSKLRWCFNCRASEVGGGAAGGCPSCKAYLNGTRLLALAKAAHS